MVDYTAARQNMVECQIRPNRVNDQRLIDAMTEIPREQFIPAIKQDLAYIDNDLEIAPGRFIMEPMVFARLAQAATISPDDVVLYIGCGTGYDVAVVARLAGTVVSLEVDEALAREASRTLIEVGADNAIVVTGPHADGYARQAPYDVIIFGGMIDYLPDIIISQLAEGGRGVGVLRRFGAVGQSTLWFKNSGQLSSRPLFEAAISPIPGFSQPEAFVF